MTEVDRARVQEMQCIKNQYDRWLNEKDANLGVFVSKFNTYRQKKSEQIRMAEAEIVKLFEYTTQLENVLEGVERGTYQLQSKQG